MDLMPDGRKVINAMGISYCHVIQIPIYMFARADGDVQIDVAMKMFIGIEKGVANKRCPNYGGNVFRYICAARLVIKMISPTGSDITLTLIIDEPLQGHLRLFRPRHIASGLMKPDKATRQKAHSFC